MTFDRKKKCIVFLCMICFLMSLFGCGKEAVTLADDVFLKMSVTAKGENVETYEMYTLNVEIHQNGYVRIYADHFNRWLSAEECPEQSLQLNPDVIKNIQDLIAESDLYHMRRNIGNRDLEEGEYKELTLYTSEGEHVSGGLNPSNRDFTRIYDYVEEQVRETEYLYRAKISQMQKQGLSEQQNKGVYITDSTEQEIVPKDEINDAYVTYGPEHLRYTEHMATPDEPVRYYVTLLLADFGAETMMNETKSCNADNISYYKLYINNEYAFTFGVQTQILGSEVYVYETTDAEEAVAMANQLRNSLY